MFTKGKIIKTILNNTEGIRGYGTKDFELKLGR